MSREIYFGTRERMDWVKAPATGTPLNLTSYHNTGSDVNGGGYVVDGEASHRDYSFEWGASRAQDVYDITDYYSGIYGSGLIYWLDPFAMPFNVCSQDMTAGNAGAFGAFIHDATVESVPGSTSGLNGLPTRGVKVTPKTPAVANKVVATNMYTNPSAERVSATSGFTRTNLFTNPAAVSGTQWGVNGGTGVTSETGSGLPNGLPSTFRRVVATSTESCGFYSVMGTSVMLPGRTYTISRYVRCTSARSVRVGCDFSGHPTQYGETITLVPGEWTRVHAVVTVPLTAGGANPVCYLAGGAPGDLIDQTAQLIEEGNQLHPYIDGNTPHAVGATSVWTGAANASASTSSFATVVRYTNIATQGAFEYDNGRFAVRRNLVKTPLISQSVAGWDVRPGYLTEKGVVSGIGRTFNIVQSLSAGSYLLGAPLTDASVIEGKAYSGGFSVYNHGTQAVWLRAAIYWPGSNTYSYGPDVLVPANGGWAELLVINAIAPAGATHKTFRVCSGGSSGVVAGTEFTMANFATLEDKPDLWGRFNGAGRGSIPDNPDFTYEWEGATNDSSSVIMVGRAGGTSASGTFTNVYQGRRWSKNGAFSLCIDGYGTRGSESTEALIGTLTGSNFVTLEPGKTYTIAAYLRIFAAGSDILNRMRRVLLYTSNNNGATYRQTVSPQAPNTPGEHFVRWTFTVEPDSNIVFLRLGGNGSANTGASWDGSRAYWDDVTVVEGEVPDLMPFDGVNSYDSDLYSAWTGAAFASTSTVSVVGAITASVGSNRAQAYMSDQWASTGSKSLRITPLEVYSSSSSTDSMTAPGGDTGAMRLGMVAGRTYTASAKIRLTEPQTGNLNGQARRIVLFYKIGSGSYQSIQSNPAPNVAGVHEVTHTFTVPVGSTEAFIRYYNGAAYGGGDVWWDDFMLTETPFKMDYFDGDTPNAGVVYSWTGTPHLSTTEAKIPSAAPVNMKPVYIPVPAGHKAWIRQYGGTAFWIIKDADSDTLYTGVNEPAIMDGGANGKFLEIYFGGNTATTHGLQIAITENGDAPDRYYLGRGNSGCLFSGTPQISGISSRLGMVGGSIQLKEVGLWQDV